ncbi:hypothetical protein CRM22_009641, partial [Opisthorchis felineus]
MKSQLKISRDELCLQFYFTVILTQAIKCLLHILAIKCEAHIKRPIKFHNGVNEAWGNR